jgi:hypothetical protein
MVGPVDGGRRVSPVERTVNVPVSWTIYRRGISGRDALLDVDRGSGSVGWPRGVDLGPGPIEELNNPRQNLTDRPVHLVSGDTLE